MSIYRKTIEFAKVIAYDRRGDPYVYGGNWDPMTKATGTDCSGCVVDELDAAINGTAMEWTRHGLSTESWRPPSMGGGADPNNGPFGTVMVSDPSQFPANAAVLMALHHGSGGGVNSHTWCQVGPLKIETNGSNGTVLNDGSSTYSDTVLSVYDTSYANNWWYLPGPVIEDGTPLVTGPSSGAVPAPVPAPTLTAAPDTLFADVSEFQAALNASYFAATYPDGGQSWPFRWISIRSNDGDHTDLNFAPNYQSAVTALNSGAADGLIVYYYWRPGSDAVNNHMGLVKSLGGPHPKMVSMIDLESGDGNPSSDVSNQVNSDYYALAQWLGDDRRVIGYANIGDERTMWQTKPEHVPMILAGYGSNPNDPNVFKIAHQYTDGQGYGAGLPEGAPPFGDCDMNSADGLSSQQLAGVLGIGTTPAPPPPAPMSDKPADQATQVSQIWDQLRIAWPQLNNRSLVDAVSEIGQKLGIPGYTPPNSLAASAVKTEGNKAMAESLKVPDDATLTGLHNEIDTVLGAVTTVLGFVEQYGSFIPGLSGQLPLIKELDSVLLAVKAFLDKVPA